MKSSVKALLVAIVFGGFGALCAVWAVVTLGRGEYLTAIAVLGFGGFCFGLPVQFIVVKAGRLSARGTFDTAGTIIRPDRRVDLLTQVWTISGVVAMGLFAIFLPLGKLDIPVPHEMRFSLSFMGGAGALMGLPMVWRNVKRGGTKYLRLAPDGFEFSEGSSSPCGEWAQVKDVTDQPPEKPPRLQRHCHGDVRWANPDPRSRFVHTGWAGQALRELVRFHWQHPEHRIELTDGRALKRLRDEQFEVN